MSALQRSRSFAVQCLRDRLFQDQPLNAARLPPRLNSQVFADGHNPLDDDQRQIKSDLSLKTL